MSESPLRRLIREGRSAGDLAAALGRAADIPLVSPEDAAAVADLVTERQDELLLAPNEPPSLLHAVLGLFQQVESEEAFRVLAERGLPPLRAIFDRLIDDEIDPRQAEDLLFLVKVFTLYRGEQDVDRIAGAARQAALCDRSLWSVIFETLDDEHPLRRPVFEALRDPLPAGFAGVAYLDFANAVARDESIDHPFDSPAGHERLEAWLVDGDDARYSYAHSAAAALPFVADPPRGRLMALGLDHPSSRVQLEAAWASARIGSRAGIDYLARACLDVRTSATAEAYLGELGEWNAVPARAKDPDFAAVAELCRWLSHPMEYGRPPDEATVSDVRTLFWPPANELRRLWIVRYVFAGARPDGSDDVGVGLVGSITFSLFGETSADMAPEDVYALHCCWELEVEHDPRSPSERSIAAGRELLREAKNDGF
jgi:hypothetical protein